MKRICLLACGIVSISPVFGGTVVATNISNPSTDIVVANMSSSALSGTIVAVGWYSAAYITTDLNNALSSNNFASLSSNLNVLTSTLTGETSADFGDPVTGPDIAGFYSTPGADYGAPDGTPPLGAQFYVLFGNASSLGGANTQYALVRFNDTVDLDTPVQDSNSLQLSGGSYTILKGTTGTAIVNLSPIGGSATESNTSLNLVAIPEPSTALFGALGMVGLLRRRRTV